MWATPTGLIARTDRLHRIDLGSRDFERELLTALRAGSSLDHLTEFHDKRSVLRAVDCLFQLHVLEPGAGVAWSPTPGVLARSDEQSGVVVLARADDARAIEWIDCARARGEPSLLVGTVGAGILLAPDVPKQSPCSRCAMLFDAELGRRVVRASLLPVLEEAERSALHASCGRTWALAARVADRMQRRRDTWPALGTVLTYSAKRRRSHTLAPHPGCRCAVTGGGRHPRSARFTWSTARARIAPVHASPRREDGLARVMFRRARGPHPWTAESWGAATAQGRLAATRALAEAIERFCMHHGRADVRGATAIELGDRVLSRAELESLLYRPEERASAGFRMPAFDPSQKDDWVWARALTSDRRALVPVSLTGRPTTAALRLVDSTTNGYAAHLDREQAVVSALLEIVERDAVLLTCFFGLDAPRLDLSPPLPSAQVRRSAVLLATQDVDLPVVWVLAELHDGSLRSSAAADTHFTRAHERAITEMRAGLLRAAPDGDPTYRWDDVGRIHGPLDHLRAHRVPGGAEALRDRLTSDPVVDSRMLCARWPGREAPRLGVVTTALQRVGLEPYIVDRGLPDLFGPGWHVVRALVPGVVELSWGRAYRRLAGHRARAHIAGGKELSTWAHPIA